MRFFVGGYTSDMRGAASGIGVLLAGGADDVLAGGPLGTAKDAVATGGSPSWIAWHPTLDVLYAALEGAGAVQAFRRTGDASFARLGGPVDAGDAVCHVAVAPDGRSLVASCWGDGRVVRMTLDAAGVPSSPVIAAAAEDPHAAAAAVGHDAGAGGAFAGGGAVTGGSGAGGVGGAGGVDLAAAVRALREAAGSEYAHLIPAVPESTVAEPAAAPADARASRAHQARFLPGGLVATTDLGLDLVRFWRDAGGLRAVQEVVLPRGTGPRHTVWHPSGHLYVVTELSREVFVLAPDATQTWRVVGGAPLSPATLDTDAAAEVTLSHDARFVYAGVRGSDAIAALRVDGSGASLAPVALVEAGVAWPRHHVVARDTLLVAGERSDEVASLTLDERTGVPGRARHRTAVPSPTCLVPDRR